MGKGSRLYSPEFKAEAVWLVQASDEKHPVPKIAKELDVSTETLRKWVTCRSEVLGFHASRV
jgi:transposase-like protein